MRKLKQELIEKLRKGECIIDNTGNPDTELLILIMNEAFNEYYGLSGTNRYYGRLSNLNTWLSTRLYRKVIGVKTNYYHFPEISLGVSSHGNVIIR